MVTIGKPFFHVVLGDGDQWVVEVEWPDGTLERIRSFKHHAPVRKFERVVMRGQLLPLDLTEEGSLVAAEGRPVST